MQLNFTSTGHGWPIVLLHGIAGSLRYWQDVTQILSKDHQVISVDLLGFGHSPHPKSDYCYSAHIKSIKQTLDSAGLKQPFILVGHSMGALIATRLAARYPNQVSKLFLFNPPLFETELEAKKDIIGGKKLFKYAYYGRSSQLLCTVWCRGLRPISRHIAPLYLRDLPPRVARDSVLHSWQAFSKSLENIIENQTVKNDLLQLDLPVMMVHGRQERPTVLKNSKKLERALKDKRNIQIKTIDGPHHLPLVRCSEVVETIKNRS